MPAPHTQASSSHETSRPEIDTFRFRGMNNRYDAADIEVLSGLDPVRRRPGMSTDTTRPNHLAQEVVDNAVY
jgi:hypothetical protein